MDNYTIKLSDFERICRICMHFLPDTKSFIPLRKTLDLINQCTSVLIMESDCKPQQLCEDCYQKLENAYGLKLLCENTDRVLNKIIEEHTDEIKVEPEIKSETSPIDFIDDTVDSFKSEDDLPLKVKSENTTNKVEENINEANNNDNQSKSKKTKRKKLVKFKYSCEKCNEKFSSKRKFRAHKHKDPNKKRKRGEKWVVCETCGKSMKQPYLKKHIASVHENVTYPCNQCSKAFYHKFSLNKHIDRVHKNIPLKYGILCNICGKGVKSAWNLACHLRSHTGETPFACEKCHKKYRQKSALKSHVARAHLDIRTHVCSICSRAFFDKRILNSHMTTHTGDKPYRCNVCDQNFGQQASLWAHTKKHHTTDIINLAILNQEKF